MKPFRVARVFGLEVAVQKIKGLLPKGLYGYYDPDSKTIGIDDSLKGHDLESTTMHEVFHAALCRVFVQQQLDEKFAEIIVENLTVAVFENWDVKWKAPKRMVRR